MQLNGFSCWNFRMFDGVNTTCVLYETRHGRWSSVFRRCDFAPLHSSPAFSVAPFLCGVWARSVTLVVDVGTDAAEKRRVHVRSLIVGVTQRCRM